MNTAADARMRKLEALVRTHQGRLRTYVYSKTGNAETADDLVQDVFLAAYNTLDTYDASREALPWLLGITRNLLREHWHSLAQDNNLGKLRAIAVNRQLEHDRVEESAEVLEKQIGALRKCLEKLPAQSRQLVEQLYERQLNCEQVAERMQKESGTVRITIFRIRKALRACVERTLGGEFA